MKEVDTEKYVATNKKDTIIVSLIFLIALYGLARFIIDIVIIIVALWT